MKLKKVILPVALVGMILAGCGQQVPQKKTSHHYSVPTSRNAYPKNTKTSEGGTKTTNTKTPNLYQKPKSNSKAPETKHQTMSTPKKATKKVEKGHHEKANDSRPTVDLGYGITGHVDSKAGQVYIYFQMGDWTIETHGNDISQSYSTAKKDAKQLDEYFQTHTLPVPNKHGKVIYNTVYNTANISWQDGNKVNTINGNASDALSKVCK